MTPHHFVRISILRMTESCKRTTYYVRLTTDEGFTIEPVSYRTGHEYTEDGVLVIVPGITASEALQGALYDAGDWSDILGLPVDPYEEEGEIILPTKRPRRRFEMQRMLKARKASAST